MTKRGRIVSTRVEHLSIPEARGRWATEVEVELVPVDAAGTIDLAALEDALDRPADLVSVMLANNEVGTIQPDVPDCSADSRGRALLHVDAIQGVGKIAGSWVRARPAVGVDAQDERPTSVGFLDGAAAWRWNA